MTVQWCGMKVAETLLLLLPHPATHIERHLRRLCAAAERTLAAAHLPPHKEALLLALLLTSEAVA